METNSLETSSLETSRMRKSVQVPRLALACLANRLSRVPRRLVDCLAIWGEPRHKHNLQLVVASLAT